MAYHDDFDHARHTGGYEMEPRTSRLGARLLGAVLLTLLVVIQCCR